MFTSIILRKLIVITIYFLCITVQFVAVITEFSLVFEFNDTITKLLMIL